MAVNSRSREMNSCKPDLRFLRDLNIKEKAEEMRAYRKMKVTAGEKRCCRWDDGSRKKWGLHRNEQHPKDASWWTRQWRMKHGRSRRRQEENGRKRSRCWLSDPWSSRYCNCRREFPTATAKVPTVRAVTGDNSEQEWGSRCRRNWSSGWGRTTVLRVWFRQDEAAHRVWAGVLKSDSCKFGDFTLSTLLVW